MTMAWVIMSNPPSPPARPLPGPRFSHKRLKDLELLRVEGSSPCGMVKVTLTGQQMPVSCDISEEAMAEGAKVLGEKVRTVSCPGGLKNKSCYYIYTGILE